MVIDILQDLELHLRLLSLPKFAASETIEEINEYSRQI